MPAELGFIEDPVTGETLRRWRVYLPSGRYRVTWAASADIAARKVSKQGFAVIRVELAEPLLAEDLRR